MLSSLTSRAVRAALGATFLISFATGALAQSADGRSTADIEKENAALRAKIHRLEVEKENIALRAKVDQLQGRRAVQTATPGIAQSQPQPLVTRVETSSPDRTLVMADMPIKTLAPPRVSDWSGFYGGVEGGWGWGRQNSDSVLAGDPFNATINNGQSIGSLSPAVSYPGVNIPSTSQNGWLAGVFFGAQEQWGNWVLGIEGDIDGAGIKGTGGSAATFASNVLSFVDPQGRGIGGSNTCTPCFVLNHNLSLESKIDMIGSLRGKAGYVLSPNWLIYGTGGAAFEHAENTIFATQTFINLLSTTNPILCSGNDGVTCSFQPNSQSRMSGAAVLFGYAAGGGVDYKLPLDAGSALVFGAEYLHYGFPQQTITLVDNAGGSRSFRINQDVDVIKGRISYLFGIH